MLWVASPGHADPTVSPPAASSVSPVIVQGGPAPHLVSSFPSEDAKVSAGVLILKLTFDQAMSSLASRLGTPDTPQTGAEPPCLAEPRLLADGKTYVILCSTKPEHAYAIDLVGKPGLVSASGRPAQPATLRFATTDTIVDNISDALDEAGLTTAEDPVMTWREVGEAPAKAALDSAIPHP